MNANLKVVFVYFGLKEEYPDNCDELLKKEIQKLKKQIKNNNHQ